ncbi:hypothetical protein PoB_004402300 [Plakobranchus ocellatus]|uniref:Uncharacterized protein n=1 Tax=Plakobranchus ocellatus TaxID=259542 RepID=A0AAV4BF83_9GAST|nr:hypothetical protein PoB_004402300 [Plakobranchus ocellatus]
MQRRSEGKRSRERWRPSSKVSSHGQYGKAATPALERNVTVTSEFALRSAATLLSRFEPRHRPPGLSKDPKA